MRPPGNSKAELTCAGGVAILIDTITGRRGAGSAADPGTATTSRDSNRARAITETLPLGSNVRRGRGDISWVLGLESCVLGPLGVGVRDPRPKTQDPRPRALYRSPSPSR